MAGCASGPKFINKEIPFPTRVAVLPFANETNEVGGPETVRKVFAKMLPLRGYDVQDLQTTSDILLQQFGINDGGQLGSVTVKELGEKLGVDGLFYGNLLQFVDLPLGFVRKRVVQAEFKLVETSSQTLLWQDKKKWITPELHLSSEEAKTAFAVQVAERQIEKITGKFLLLESKLVVLNALKELPVCRAIDSDNFLDQQRQAETEFREKLRGRIELK